MLKNKFTNGFTPLETVNFNGFLDLFKTGDFKKNKENKNKFLTGFTLTELLVAMAIIGILSAIVLTSMSGARERAKDGRRITDIKQIQLALELYYDVNSTYPDTDTGIYGTVLSDFLNVSHDPDGSEYKYWSSGQDYHLGTVLQQYNKLLEEDADATTGFSGSGANCASATGDERCYDVIP
ncbi:MAG: prepilin-type N-terminal cleavage/methylation domain-containing protein [Candidatus Pacebacteria bacterium]|nr:prepilin-type N-terminal cleavage/methylation domain-containing protein [Candidatus Paceibacterota bacterium]